LWLVISPRISGATYRKLVAIVLHRATALGSVDRPRFIFCGDHGGRQKFSMVVAEREQPHRGRRIPRRTKGRAARSIRGLAARDADIAKLPELLKRPQY
jgi:hypothetical protein